MTGDDQGVSKVKKRKLVSKVQENVQSPTSTTEDLDGDEVSISTQDRAPREAEEVKGEVQEVIMIPNEKEKSRSASDSSPVTSKPSHQLRRELQEQN